MKKLLLITLLFIPLVILSQQIKGRIVSDSVIVNQVLIVNINYQEKTYSDSKGQFLINANIGDELRFLKDGYDRKNIIVKDSKELFVTLSKQVIEIEEVEVKKKLSGNLVSDSKLFNENKKKVALNNDLKDYFKTKSTEELMKPRHGEFVQPVGGGFSFGEIKNKWKLPDLVEWLRENLTDEYFISMGFESPEINSFLFYSLQSFNTRYILKYGYCNDGDVAKLKLHFETSFKKFKNK